MLNKVETASLSGVEGYPVTVETDLRKGMPEFAIVGLADTTIRESCKRTKPAIENSGFRFPVEKLTVNLMPAARPIKMIVTNCMICVPVDTAETSAAEANWPTIRRSTAP